MTCADLKPVLAHGPGRVTVSDLIEKIEEQNRPFRSVQAALCGMQESLKKSVFHGCVQKYLGMWGKYYDRSQTLTTRSQFILQLSIAFIDELLVSYGTDYFSFFEDRTIEIREKQTRILQGIFKAAILNKHAISLRLEFLLLREDVSDFSSNMQQEFDNEKTVFVEETKESIVALNTKARTQLNKGAFSTVVSDLGMGMVASGVGAPVGACLWVGGAIATYAYTGKAVITKLGCWRKNSIVKEAEAHSKVVVGSLKSCEKTIGGIGERLGMFVESWQEIHDFLEGVNRQLELMGTNDFDDPVLLQMLNKRSETLVRMLMDMRGCLTPSMKQLV